MALLITIGCSAPITNPPEVWLDKKETVSNKDDPTILYIVAVMAIAYVGGNLMTDAIHIP